MFWSQPRYRNTHPLGPYPYSGDAAPDGSRRSSKGFVFGDEKAWQFRGKAPLNTGSTMHFRTWNGTLAVVRKLPPVAEERHKQKEVENRMLYSAWFADQFAQPGQKTVWALLAEPWEADISEPFMHPQDSLQQFLLPCSPVRMGQAEFDQARSIDRLNSGW